MPPSAGRAWLDPCGSSATPVAPAGVSPRPVGGAGGGRVGDDTARRQRPASARRGVAVTSLVRSLIVSVAIVGGYFVLPMTHFDGRSAVTLMGGAVVVGVLLAWQIRAIARSPYPRVRATGALATSLPLFFAVFATTYFAMSRAEPSNFSEH